MVKKAKRKPTGTGRKKKCAEPEPVRGKSAPPTREFFVDVKDWDGVGKRADFDFF